MQLKNGIDAEQQRLIDLCALKRQVTSAAEARKTDEGDNEMMMNISRCRGCSNLRSSGGPTRDG